MIAVISDVHGNLPALEAVLADIDAAGVHRVWCLGDTLGYGPSPVDCLRIVFERCEIVLAGNHDLAVRGDLRASDFLGTAGTGIAHAIAQVSTAPDAQAMLAGLRPSHFLDEVEMYHASARDPVWEYVRDEASAREHLSVQRLPLSLVGHSHLPLCFTEVSPGKARGGLLDANAVVPLDGSKRVFNPGSVGQPRDRDPRASWALVSPGSVTMRRVTYDIARTRAMVVDAGLPSEVGERLELGW